MRRLIIEEPVSRAALWAPRMGWFAVAVTVIAVVLLRSERVELLPGVVTLLLGFGFAALAGLLALAGFVRIWIEGRRGLGSALFGLLLAVAVLAWPAVLAARAVLLPAIIDVTTDVVDPPAFSRSQAAMRARDGTVPPEPPAETRTRQRLAYPRIASLTLDRPVDETFDLALKAAERRRLRIIERTRPGGRTGAGRIEAVDRTTVLRLPEDVTIRVRPLAEGTRLDVRSASRIGPHDVGSNAARIRTFLDTVSELALAEK
ncbi:DUF1499 domain-containing protein [Salinarimonas soli]|uniref:DUF1499 domain-containing protein n=1 Tax=Salinarimonas soli TaxID=1638099 RepID=A0A5B2VB39_9HYPH|nr:DUF1499 domain-containing protein [Salinarimonas soli]KAA2236251.1 DUF1499 domain-containing protein [Salinarimonas soli]